MTSYKHNRPGVGAVGQYQMSGQPYIGQGEITGPDTTPLANFHYVTKFVTVINTTTGSNVPMRVGFSANGVGTSGENYFVLNNGESYTGEWRCRDIYAYVDSGDCTYTVIAGMTGIVSELSGAMGSNFSGSQGIG
tara:strand:- start:1832 stop:2236 length:405 start_codon:yes stop_codon:yes gene_type:complete